MYTTYCGAPHVGADGTHTWGSPCKQPDVFRPIATGYDLNRHTSINVANKKFNGNLSRGSSAVIDARRSHQMLSETMRK
jgi:hypothetical protein